MFTLSRSREKNDARLNPSGGGLTSTGGFSSLDGKSMGMGFCFLRSPYFLNIFLGLIAVVESFFLCGVGRSGTVVVFDGSYGGLRFVDSLVPIYDLLSWEVDMRLLVMDVGFMGSLTFVPMLLMWRFGRGWILIFFIFMNLISVQSYLTCVASVLRLAVARLWGFGRIWIWAATVITSSWFASFPASMEGVVLWTAVVMAAMVGSASATSLPLVVSAVVMKSAELTGVVVTFPMLAAASFLLIRVYSLGFFWIGLVGFGLNSMCWASIRLCWMNWVFMAQVENFF